MDLHFTLDARTRGDHGRGLSAPRRHPARDRAGGGPHRHARGGRARRPSGRSVPSAHRRPPDRAAAAPDAAGDARLELRAASRDRAHRPAPPGRLRRRLHAGGGERRRGGRRPRRAGRVGQRREPGREVARGRGRSRAPSRATGCSRRRGPTRSRSSPRAASSTRSPDATRNITATSSSGPKSNARRAPPSSGWPPMAGRSTTCGRRWTGRSRPSGDASIGVALTAAAVPLWFQQSLLVECRGRAERALASLGPRPGRRRAPRDAALRRPRRVAHAHEGGGARHHRGLDHRPRDRRRASPTPSISSGRSGASGISTPAAASVARRWRWRKASATGSANTGRSARRRADGRCFAALPGRPDERAAAPRAHAQSLCRPGSPIARHPLSIRPEGRGPHDPGAGPLAAGIPRSGPADRSRERRGRAGGRSRALAVQRAGGRVPGRDLERRSGGRRTLGDGAARPFGTARAGRPARRRRAASTGPCSSSAARWAADSSSSAPRRRRAPRDQLRRVLPSHARLRWRKAWPGWGRSPRPSRRSTRRSPNPSVTRSVGGSPSSCASRPSLSCWREARAPPASPRSTSSARCSWTRKQGALSLELRCATGLARLWHAPGPDRGGA